MRYHLTPVRMTISSKSVSNQVLPRMWRKGNPCALLVGMQIGTAIKNGPALWPSDSESHSNNIVKETQNTDLKEYMYPYLHCSVIYNSQDLEAAQVSVSRWMDKKAVVHLRNGILLGYKNVGNLTFCDSVNGPGEYYVKWNKPVRERQVPYDFTCVWNLMNKIN